VQELGRGEGGGRHLWDGSSEWGIGGSRGTLGVNGRHSGRVQEKKDPYNNHRSSRSAQPDELRERWKRIWFIGVHWGEKTTSSAEMAKN